VSERTKKILIGVAIMVVPGAGIAAGAYLIYKGLRKKKPQVQNQFGDQKSPFFKEG